MHKIFPDKTYIKLIVQGCLLLLTVHALSLTPNTLRVCIRIYGHEHFYLPIYTHERTAQNKGNTTVLPPYKEQLDCFLLLDRS